MGLCQDRRVARAVHSRWKVNPGPAIDTPERREIPGARRTPRAQTPQPAPRADGSLLLTGGNWRLQNAMSVNAPPERVATADFVDADWLPAVVPGTVLTSYLAAGAIPDPRFGDQQEAISDAFFTHNDFWYRNTFTVPADYAGRRIWLHFDGINWKAEIFLNGAAVGRIDGAFIRGRFDVSPGAKPGAVNCLAVLIHRVANPGVPKHRRLGDQYPNGGILGLDSPTFVSSIGWNWLPTIRGRNIGIWNEVRLEATVRSRWSIPGSSPVCRCLTPPGPTSLFMSRSATMPPPLNPGFWSDASAPPGSVIRCRSVPGRRVPWRWTGPPAPGCRSTGRICGGRMDTEGSRFAGSSSVLSRPER